MLHILLLILKIIGIILAAILGIAMLLICIVLFVPLRYQITAKTEGRPEHMDVHAKMSWCFHLISGCASFREGKLQWRFRIFWKKFPSGVNVPETVSEETPKANVPEAVSEAGFSEKIPEEKVPEDEIPEEKVPEDEVPEDEVPEDEVPEEKGVTGKTAKEKHKTEKKKSFFEKIKYTYQSICAKIKLFSERKEKLAEFIADTVHKSAFLRAKKELIRLLKFLRPKRIKGKVRFGFEDPYHTGRVLAVLGMLYPFYGEDINIYPEFEQKVLEGDLFIKGHIRCMCFVMIIWNLFFDKNVRTTYKHIKTFKF